MILKLSGSIFDRANQAQQLANELAIARFIVLLQTNYKSDFSKKSGLCPHHIWLIPQSKKSMMGGW
jgi:hypothetical protein